jgi:hypothetical protein
VERFELGLVFPFSNLVFRQALDGLTFLALFVDIPDMLFRYAMINTWFSASELGVICRGSWKLILPV